MTEKPKRHGGSCGVVFLFLVLEGLGVQAHNMGDEQRATAFIIAGFAAGAFFSMLNAVIRAAGTRRRCPICRTTKGMS